MSIDKNTPVLVGVGEVTEPVPSDLANASSPVALASKAALAALQDAGIAANDIDVIAMVRTWADSIPIMPSPFGTSNQPPRSLANAIGATPKLLIHSQSGGNTPQQLVSEWAEKLHDGEASVVLLAGAEATANTKAALRAQQKLDWSEQLDGPIQDRGIGLQGMIGIRELQHSLMMPTTQYAIAENARRAQLGRSYSEHAQANGELLAPFSDIAAANEYAMSRQRYSAEEIATPSEKNTYVDLPYTYRMIAKDNVNQGAALLLTTAGKASELGIDRKRWVYLHAYAQAEDLPMLERENLGTSVALTLCYQLALKSSGLTAKDISIYDIYSCYPIVIELAKEALGISDPDIPLTQTGGLPFFGGPGNNYAMHAIAAVVRKLRENPEEFGLVGTNGGMINKHAIGIYSCKPGWRRCDSSELCEQIVEQQSPEFDNDPNGTATIETYTVTYWQGTPFHGIVIGRMKNSGARFIANNFEGDSKALQQLVDEDCVGQTIYVASRGKGNVFTFSKEQMRAQLPKPATQLRESYKYCSVKVSGKVLEVTIDRPDAYNALHPMANEELAEVFDVYMSSPELWVAIITGSGERAFCTGNDLKYSASGKPVWFPKSGFGGLTSRRGRNKPVIAAVNGFAMGGGMEIALACDIVFAAESAVFGLPEVKRGLIAAAGGLVRLTRQIPHKQAMDIILTGRNVGAVEAHQLGFVNRIVKSEKLMQCARDYAATLCENSPSSIRLSMDLINEHANQGDTNVAAGSAGKVLDELLTSEDFYEGPKAFAEKRPPKWSGR